MHTHTRTRNLAPKLFVGNLFLSQRLWVDVLLTPHYCSPRTTGHAWYWHAGMVRTALALPAACLARMTCLTACLLIVSMLMVGALMVGMLTIPPP